MAGNPCTVCSHPDAVEINEALVVRGASNRRTSSQYGMSEAAIRRHQEHIPKLLVKASEALEVANADDLLDKVRYLASRAEGILDKAEDAGELSTALGGIRELRGTLELLARLMGELQDGGTTVNIVQNPQFVQVQAVIVQALTPYPEARRAVVDALDALEDGAEAIHHDSG